MSETGEPRRAEAELEALRAERLPRTRASPRRAVLLLLLLVLIALVSALGVRSFLRPRPPPPAEARESAIRAAQDNLARIEAQNWSRVEILSPSRARRDPETGELTAPFQGFGISVDSTPAGARVLVDGGEMGDTPLVASIDCEAGREVEVRVEKAGYRAQRRAVRCRADALVRVEVRLERGAAPRR
jgi:PEGA domain